MPQLDNFDAWISIDDHPLQEYAVKYSEDLLTAVCWIASEDDKVRLFRLSHLEPYVIMKS
jgi:hypothetical protein